MNIFYKAFCRTYQTAFKIVANFLPWRTPTILDGANSLSGLADELIKRNVKNALIVTDNNIVKLGLHLQLTDALTKNNFKYSVFSDVQPNPTFDNVENGLNVFLQNGCDCIVAIGGGSPIDCAKAIGARAVKPKKPLYKMKGVLKILKKLPLFVAVPTTAGTGSETTLASVVVNPKTRLKFAINDPSLIPHLCVLDPTLLVNLPKILTATTGVDALTHAVEAYIGNSNTKKTKQNAVDAIKLIFDNLTTCCSNPTDLDARYNMQVAAFKAGAAFTRAYVGYVHAIAHTFGGLYNTPHGLANAVLLPIVLRKYGKSAHKKLAQLANVIGVASTQNTPEQNANAFIDAIEKLNEQIEIPKTITGINKNDYDAIVSRALAEANPLYPVPQLWDKQQIISVLDSLQNVA